MRYGLTDLLIAIFFVSVGVVAALPLHHLFPSCVTGIPIAVVCGLCLYMAVAAPIYRRFRLFPLILPRCPCCGKFQNGFHFIHDWPRVFFRCPTCKGEFVIWLDGRAGDTETWDRPVLALKWPYVFGRYKKVNKPTAVDSTQTEVSR
jgi:hypothetical protein